MSQNFRVDRRDGTCTIATSDTTKAGTNSEVINGMCRWIEFLTADMQDTDSTQLDITSGAGGTLYTSGTKAESTRVTVGTVFPMHGTIKLIFTAEGTQSANRTPSYSIYYTP